MREQPDLLCWRTLAAPVAVVLLLAALLCPATSVVVLAAGVVLLPVALFGFVLVPLALGPEADWIPRLTVPVLVQARLFQRPPPISLQ